MLFAGAYCAGREALSHAQPWHCMALHESDKVPAKFDNNQQQPDSSYIHIK